MTFATLRVLVAENQYLIAMEVERLLHETLVCEVTIAPLAQLSDVMLPGRFDVVVVEAVLTEAQNIENINKIHEAGARPIFLSSFDPFPANTSVVSDHPIVAKPPQAEELTAAITRATRHHRASDSKGLLDHS